MKITKNLAFSTLAATLAFLTASLFAGETYEYDLQGRLAKVIYEDSTSIAYTYDNNGNILTIEVAGDVGTSVEGPPERLTAESFCTGSEFSQSVQSGNSDKISIAGGCTSQAYHLQYAGSKGTDFD